MAVDHIKRHLEKDSKKNGLFSSNPPFLFFQEPRGTIFVKRRDSLSTSYDLWKYSDLSELIA